MKWEEVKLGNHVDFASGPAFKSKDFTDNPKDIPLIKGENIGIGCILWEKSKYYPEAEAKYYQSAFLELNDIVLAMDRPWIEAGLKFGWIKENDPPSLLVQRVARLRGVNGLSQTFLRYIVSSSDFAIYLKNIQGGVGVPHISGGQIKAFSFSLPPLPTQQKIASILSAYDDLIENNLKRIRLLEEAAQHLYREWFVRFRFPGWEEVEVVDGLPVGWGEKTLGEMCHLTMGQSPSSDFYNEHGEGLPFHQGVTNYGHRFVSHKTFCTNETRIAEEGDILCSVRAPVGRLNVTIDKIVIGRGLSAMRNKDSLQSFQFYQLKNHFVQEDMIGGGTIFSSVTKKELESQVFVCPTKELMELFERVCKPMDEQIRNLHLQNQKLKEARDILLPRLMNQTIKL